MGPPKEVRPSLRKTLKTSPAEPFSKCCEFMDSSIGRRGKRRVNGEIAVRSSRHAAELWECTFFAFRAPETDARPTASNVSKVPMTVAAVTDEPGAGKNTYRSSEPT